MAYFHTLLCICSQHMHTFSCSLFHAHIQTHTLWDSVVSLNIPQCQYGCVVYMSMTPSTNIYTHLHKHTCTLSLQYTVCLAGWSRYNLLHSSQMMCLCFKKLIALLFIALHWCCANCYCKDQGLNWNWQLFVLTVVDFKEEIWCDFISSSLVWGHQMLSVGKRTRTFDTADWVANWQLTLDKAWGKQTES